MTAFQLRKLRRSKGLTQTEVAKILKVTGQGYRNWEQERIPISYLHEVAINVLLDKHKPKRI